MKAVKEAVDQSNAKTKDLLYSTTKLSNQLLRMMQTLQGQPQKTMPPHPSLQLMPPQPKGHNVDLTRELVQSDRRTATTPPSNMAVSSSLSNALSDSSSSSSSSSSLNTSPASRSPPMGQRSGQQHMKDDDMAQQVGGIVDIIPLPNHLKGDMADKHVENIIAKAVEANVKVTRDSSEELYDRWVSFMCQRWAADKWPNTVRAGQILLAKLPPLGLYVNTTATFRDILAIINFSLASRETPNTDRGVVNIQVYHR